MKDHLLKDTSNVFLLNHNAMELENILNIHDCYVFIKLLIFICEP